MSRFDLFFFIFVSSIVLIIQFCGLRCTAQPNYLYHFCLGGNYTANSTYQDNLNNILLPSLSSFNNNTVIRTGFGNATTGGRNPDIVYGSFQCRGDLVTSPQCQECVQTAAKDITGSNRCPNSKQAIIWYDPCMFRYSNQSFFSIMQDRPGFYLSNTQNITNPDLFNRLLGDLMDNLVQEAVSRPGSSNTLLFATGQTNFTEFQKIYGLVQCTSDLSSSDCSRCLRGALAQLPTCCGGKQGGRVIGPSCNFRYEIYPFVESTGPPPPPPLVVPPPTTPRSSTTTNYDEQYNKCGLKFHCGNVSASFPFWGQERPSYCGHPGFELDCSDDNITSITDMAASQRYRVIDVNEENQILTIARMDIFEGICPAPSSAYNFMTNFPLFDFISTKNQDLLLLYGCTVDLPSVLFDVVYNFTCKVNDAPRDLYITGFAGFVTPNIQTIGRCNDSSLVVPVLQTVATEFLANNPTNQGVDDVLNKGFQVRWKIEGEQCRRCVESRGNCGFNDDASDPKFVCFCSNGPRNGTCGGSPVSVPSGPPGGSPVSVPSGPPSDPKGNVKRKLALGVGGSVGGVIFASSLFMLIRCFIKKSSSNTSLSARFWNETNNNNNHPNMQAFFQNYGSLAPKRFRYKDVKKMTNSFKEKLGQGGFGSVFKGRLQDGRLVAVKVLISKSKTNNGEDFLNEVASISRTSHVNVVTLLGFCFEKKKRALIYEFMPNGSLDKFIYSEKLLLVESDLKLGFDTLYKVAVGIARGLEYLHRGCNTQILHFDIKPHNILLDENLCPKISDFGLAKLCPGKESIISMLGARGTAGYIAPEVFSRNFGGVSHKSDVYSYGMMVLEMVGGRKNIDVKVGIDHSSQLYFPHWIYDRLKLEEGLGLQGVTMTEEREEVAKKMIIVGLWCIQTNPLSRPSMTKVLEMLEGSIHALQIPPKPFLSSPPRSPPQQISSSTISIS